MSTDLYLVCTSHEEEIRTWDEVGRLSSLHRVREDLLNRKELVSLIGDLQSKYDLDLDQHWDSGRNRAILFMMEHPTCEIVIRDEYGHSYSLTETEEEEAVRLSRKADDVIRYAKSALGGTIGVWQENMIRVAFGPPPPAGRPCYYIEEWTDEVGDVPVCRIHKTNSRHKVKAPGFDRPCLTIDPYPKEQ